VSTSTPDISTEFIPTDKMESPLFGHITRHKLVKETGKSEMFWIRLARAGKGPPITRLGRTPLYRLTDLQAWLESQQRSGKARARGRR
jgi:hypothetical protein